MTNSIIDSNLTDESSKSVKPAERINKPRGFSSTRKKLPGGLLARVPDKDINLKNLALLERHISVGGRILPSRITGASRSKQRKLSKAIKHARHVGLLPFVTQFKK